LPSPAPQLPRRVRRLANDSLVAKRERRRRPATRRDREPTQARAWSTFGPQSIGAQRFVAVCNGASFAQVADVILGKQARVENPDKDAALR
jgi:hypothetical protein